MVGYPSLFFKEQKGQTSALSGGWLLALAHNFFNIIHEWRHKENWRRDLTMNLIKITAGSRLYNTKDE